MTQEQKQKIITLRRQGLGYTAVANALNLKKDTVASFCRRNGLMGKIEGEFNISDLSFCKNCGGMIKQRKGTKHKKFCSDNCRTTWWNAHQDMVNKKADYSFICANCGKEFFAYGNSKRKYCCHGCYISSRFRGGVSCE